MLILFTCLLINSFIGVIFKMFDKFQVNNNQAITINYFVCLLTGSLVLGKFALPGDLFVKAWFWIAVLMGLLFVVTFNLMALTVQKFGVGIATIFQKMSLVAPAILAILIYGEPSPWSKIVGLLLAVLAIVLLSFKKQNKTEREGMGWIVFLPLIVFLGSCVIDSGLYLVEEESMAPNGDIEFISSLFFFAGMFGLVQIVFLALRKDLNFEFKNLVGGVALGIPNFFSIYLILVLLANGWEGSVIFPINNVGVLILAALFGYLFFGEKLTGIRLIGFITACIAIALIAI